MCLRGFLQFLGGLTIPNVSTCALSLILSAYGVNAWFFWLVLVVSLASYVKEKDLRRGIVVGCVASMWALHGVIVLLSWIRGGSSVCRVDDVRFQNGFADVN